MKTKAEMNEFIFAKIDASIKKGSVTVDELRKQAEKASGCLADCYLKDRGLR